MGTLEIAASGAICRKCGVAYSGKVSLNFATSYAQLYRGSGHLPYCRSCVNEIFEKYYLSCKDAKKAVRQTCRKLDLYWSESIYEYAAVRSSSRSVITAYMTRANSKQYLGKSYDDTLIEEGTLWEPANPATITGIGIVGQEEDIYVEPEIREFWGADFAADFVLKLDKRYKDWTDGQEDLDRGSISLFKQICILEETIARDAAAGRAVDKNMNTLNTLLGSANLKPVQKKDDVAGGSVDASPMGVWIRRFENERPIPEPDPELRDVDKIVRYIQVFFLGHLAKMLGKTTVYSKMYEDEIARLRVESPDMSREYDDDEEFFENRFGATEDGDDS